MEKSLETPGAVVQVSLKAEGPGPPVAIRLRRWLKAALRGYGLRCTAVDVVVKDSAPPRASAG